MFTGIASSDCDTISIQCIIKFYLDFFQTIKLCCQEHVQALRIYTYEFLRKKQFFVTFWVWLYEKQLGSFRGIYRSPRCCWYVKISFIFILNLCDQGGWHAYRDLAFRSEMGWTKIDTNTPAWWDENYTNAYVPIWINNELNLFLWRGYEHV